MKKLSIYMLLFACLLFSWSCEEESNMEEVGNWEISEPVPSTPTSDASIILDETAPSSEVAFEWGPAVTSNRFVVGYRFLLVDAAAPDLSAPIMEIVPSSAGKDKFVKPTAEQIDYALWAKCYEPGQAADLKWVVVAKAIEKESQASSPITITRFSSDRQVKDLLITGTATEAGADVTTAASMRARTDGEGAKTGVFDIYTTLTEGSTFSFRDQANAMAKVFGGAEGALAPCGAEIASPETAQYRVTVDLNNNSYDLWKVDRWSLVGDAVPGGWGGDVPLTYVGNGVWQADIDFQYPYDGAGFIFRANSDWGYIMKQVKGTAAADGKSGSVIMESEAASAGVEVEDSKIVDTGLHTVTLDLKTYTFSIVPVPVDPGDNQAIIGKTTTPEADVVQGNFLIGEYEMPETMFLLSGGEVVAELTIDGDKFTTLPNYLALEASKTYTLNSASDGSGTVYNSIGDGSISVDHDQAYAITVDFAEGKLLWKHYNLKLFHWDEVGGGWDQRTETPLTYTHPYKFQATGIALTGGFHSKVFSPWEVDFGSTDTGLSGTFVNPGSNYKGIAQSGTYDLSLTITDTDYSTASFTFVKK